MPSQPTYSLEQAEDEIADQRGATAYMDEVLPQNDTDLVPNTPTAGNTQYSSSGQQKYVGSDGNAYNTGRASFRTQADQTVSSTSATPVAGITSIPVDSGAYRISGVMTWTQVTTNVTQRLGWSGTFQAGTRIKILSVPGAGATSSYPDEVTSNSAVTLPGFATGQNIATWIEGIIVFNAVDSFGLTVWEGTSGDSWTVKAGTFLDVMPIS